MLVSCCALFAGYDFLTRRRMMALMERSAELRAQSALAKNRHTFLSMARMHAALCPRPLLFSASLMSRCCCLFRVCGSASARCQTHPVSSDLCLSSGLRLRLLQVSHEVRTPASAILGAVELLQTRGQLTEEQAELLPIIAEGANHILNLVQAALVRRREEGEQPEGTKAAAAAAAALLLLGDLVVKPRGGPLLLPALSSALLRQASSYRAVVTRAADRPFPPPFLRFFLLPACSPPLRRRPAPTAASFASALARSTSGAT